MIFLYYFFAIILIYFSYKSVCGGIDYLNFFKDELSKPNSNFKPFVSVIAPCKGLDHDLEKNLQALFEQDFSNYEIIFVVDDEKDEAVNIIKNLIDSRVKNQDSRLIIAKKTIESSQKVENLREAVLHVSENSEIFVFVDSDARPNKNWLQNLIAPLQDENIGCSSGYRWFISKNFGLANELRSAWNASIASQLGKDKKSNFCWGGSTAIRRKVFEKLDLREKWKGTLSDDFVVTRTMHKANLPIFHVPQCLVATVENTNFREVLEFTTRQMKITRVYAQKLWILSFIGSGLFNLVMISSFLLLIFTENFWFPIITIALVTGFSIGKNWLRLKAVKLVLKDYEHKLNAQFWTQNTLFLITPLLFFYNCFCALLSRKIIWRGIKYRLTSPNKTEIV